MRGPAYELGIGDGKAPLGSHIGFWYRSVEEKTEALLDYFFAGIKSKQFCLYACPDAERDAFLAAGARRLGEPLSDVRLQVVSAEEFYFDGGGFSPDRLSASLPEIVRQAQSAGFASVRAAGELPARLRGRVQAQSFMEYEERISREFFSRMPALGLCLFSMDGISHDWMLGLLRTHPYMLSKSGLFDNPAYRAP